jgi:tetratricopeptide (TPR) repeat protein
MDQRGQRSLPGSTLPPLVMTLHQQAVSLYRAGNPADALRVCRQILALAPKLPEVLAFAGRASMDLGEIEQAVSFYEAAVASKRDFAEAHYNLGIAGSLDEYVDISTRLATDSAWQAAIRAKIAANRPRLYGDQEPIRALETWIAQTVRSDRSLNSPLESLEGEGRGKGGRGKGG